MAVSKEVKKEREDLKKNAARILKKQGIDYETWLSEQHTKYILDNLNVVFEEKDEKQNQTSNTNEGNY